MLIIDVVVVVRTLERGESGQRTRKPKVIRERKEGRRGGRGGKASISSHFLGGGWVVGVSAALAALPRWREKEIIPP